MFCYLVNSFWTFAGIFQVLELSTPPKFANKFTETVRCLKWRNGSLLSVLKHQNFIYAIVFSVYRSLIFKCFNLFYYIGAFTLLCDVFKVDLTVCKHNLNIKTQIKQWNGCSKILQHCCKHNLKVTARINSWCKFLK